MGKICQGFWRAFSWLFNYIFVYFQLCVLFMFERMKLLIYTLRHQFYCSLFCMQAPVTSVIIINSCDLVIVTKIMLYCWIIRSNIDKLVLQCFIITVLVNEISHPCHHYQSVYLVLIFYLCKRKPISRQSKRGIEDEYFSSMVHACETWVLTNDSERKKDTGIWMELMQLGRSE